MTTQASPELTALMNRLPDLDDKGKLTGPEPAKAEAVFNELLAAGDQRIGELIALIVTPGEPSDWKARYLLHGLAVHVGAPDRTEQRRLFIETLTSHLGKDHPAPVGEFIIQQLQVTGGRDATDQIGALLLDQALCEPATQALLAIGEGAVEQFRKALPQAKGKSRVTISQAIGVLRDVESVSALAPLADDQDADVRIAAVWAYGNIGAPEAISTVLNATNAEHSYEKIAAVKAALLMAERSIQQGRKDMAHLIYKRLKDQRTEPWEQYIRDAANRGLDLILAAG